MTRVFIRHGRSRSGMRHKGSMAALVLAGLVVTGCSAFQGADISQNTPVAQVEQTKLAPLPAVAPGAAGQAVSTSPPRSDILTSSSNRPSIPPIAVLPAPPADQTGVALLPPASPGRPLATLPPPRAPGSLAGAAIATAPAAGPAFTPQTPRFLSGDWRVGEPGVPTPCRLILSSSGVAGVLDATTQGCASVELSRTAAWQSRGEDIVLLDQRASPIVLFRPVGANRYEGLGLVGATFVLSR